MHPAHEHRQPRLGPKLVSVIELILCVSPGVGLAIRRAADTDKATVGVPEYVPIPASVLARAKADASWLLGRAGLKIVWSRLPSAPDQRDAVPTFKPEITLKIAGRPPASPPPAKLFPVGLRPGAGHAAKNLPPRQTRAPSWPSRRHPGALLPVCLRHALRQCRQGLGGRFSGTDITPDPFDLGPDLRVPALERLTIDLQKKLQV